MAPTLSLEGYFKEPVSSVTDLLDYIDDFSAEKPLAVFFDEFQGVLGLNDAIGVLATMRSEIQMHGRTPYIFAGSIRRKMHEIFIKPKHPFYKSALPIEIGPMAFEEFGPIVKDLFSGGDRRIDFEYLRNLYDMLYGNTGDCQQLCSALWEASLPGTTLDANILRDALEMVWETEMPYYATIRKALTVQQNHVLLALALTDGREPYGARLRQVAGDISPGTVQKAIAKLKDMDLIFQPYDTKDYRFYAPFFKLWLVSQVTYPFIPHHNGLNSEGTP